MRKLPNRAATAWLYEAICYRKESRRLDRRIVRLVATQALQHDVLRSSPLSNLKSAVGRDRVIPRCESASGGRRPMVHHRLGRKVTRVGLPVAPNVRLRRTSRRHLSTTSGMQRCCRRLNSYSTADCKYLLGLWQQAFSGTHRDLSARPSAITVGTFWGISRFFQNSC